jgi:lysyl-tRNA synthetase, class II
MAYPNSFVRTHLAGRLLSQYGEMPVEELARVQPVVAVAGRLVEKAEDFGILQDRSGRMPIAVTQEAVGKAGHAAYAGWQVGDIIGIAGLLCRLPNGTLAVRAHELERLAPALRPLAGEGAGYLAMLSDERKRRVFEIRTRVLAAIRAYLGGTAYVEVETPLLQAEPPEGAAHFTSRHNALAVGLRLRTSAETYLKRLLVGGMEKVYEINRSFVNESAAEFFPEGTLLELYCAYSSYLYPMALLEQLLARVAQQALGSTAIPWQGQTLELAPPYRRVAANLMQAEPLAQPTYVVDFAAHEAPRARAKIGAPQVAEMFRLFIGGHQIAEGRSELNDPDSVAQCYDAGFARAVEYGLPPASSVAVSIDRLVMVLTGSASMRDVVLFPAHADR